MSACDRSVLGDVLVRRAASPGADRVAFDDGHRRISFAQLLESATARAAAFQGLGVGAGDRVALVMSAGIPFVEVFWGLQLIGAVPCALSPSSPAAALKRRLGEIDPRLTVSDAGATDLHRAGPAMAEPEIASEATALLQLTSGTSGEPRAVMITHRNVLAFLESTSGHLRADDVLVAWVPPWHDLGLMRFVVSTVYHGCVCHIVQPTVWAIPDWLATISRAGGTMTAAPDFCYRLAVRMVDPGAVALTSLRYASIAAEPVRWTTIEAFEHRFGISGAVLPGYGLAEATLAVTIHLPGDEVVVDARGNVSCGTPIPGLEVRAGATLSAPDMIRVRGEVVFPGYFRAAQDTRAALRDGWLLTGDTGYLDAEERLFVLGRRSSMIKRGGAVIAPLELEEAAEQTKGVRAAAAVSVVLPPSAEETIAVVVEAGAAARRRADEIAAEVSRAIVASVGFAPGRVSVVPPRTIPRAAGGKVRHEQLRIALSEGVIG
jgi:fatty-acyl-CoA synthase